MLFVFEKIAIFRIFSAFSLTFFILSINCLTSTPQNSCFNSKIRLPFQVIARKIRFLLFENYLSMLFPIVVCD